jgi:hypothetical protein
MNVSALSRAATRTTMLLCVYVLVAAASYCGFLAKYGFRDGDAGTSLVAIIDGTAERPYVYRQLLPAVVNVAAKAVPQALEQRFLAHLATEAPKHSPLRASFAHAAGSDAPPYALRYYMAYGLTFGALVAAMLMLRRVCMEVTGNEAASTLAPLAFAIAMPASFYYDFIELLFMALAVWLALRGRWQWLIPLTLVATFNKESFAVFVIALYPLVRQTASRRTALLGVAACVAVGALVNIAVKLHYAHNPGQPAIFNLWLNLHFLLNPRNYLLGEWTYGVLLPKGVNVLILAALAFTVRAGWRALPRALRQHTLIAAAINVPLFIALGYQDEVRALSMLFVPATLVMCASIAAYLAGAGATARVAAAPVEAAAGARAAQVVATSG